MLVLHIYAAHLQLPRVQIEAVAYKPTSGMSFVVVSSSHENTMYLFLSYACIIIYSWP